jgi:hypothetical protein
LHWLRVLAIAELSQVHQRVCYQLHPIVPLLQVLKTQEQPLAFVFPRKGPINPSPYGVNNCIE